MNIRGTVVVTCVTSETDVEATALLAQSLRAFGGCVARSPILTYAAGDAADAAVGEHDRLDVVRLDVPGRLSQCPLAEKVCACADAERRMGSPAGTLI